MKAAILKILTSALRNKVSQFLTSNNYIGTNIQRVLLTEFGQHLNTIHLAYVVNNARKSQRPLFATLLDLRNLFRQVRHNLIDCVL